MRVDRARSRTIDEGLARIRRELDLPPGFPPDVLAAAERAVERGAGAEHVDRTDVHFVTLDPAEATDLDQALHLERSGDDLVLHYAIADVGWFVHHDDPLDREAWRRGTTMYLPDGRVPLYPPVLSEGAASLLPDGPRPAVVFTVRLRVDGTPTLDGVERAVVRSRAKLAYDRVRDGDLPVELPEFARRMAIADERRGATRIDAPEQEVERDGDRYRIDYRPRLASEDHNAALSLATNLAVADALHAAGTGLFRTMAGPDDRHLKRLRHTARALGIDWPDGRTLAEFERSLRAGDPAHAAMTLAIRRAGGAARYEPFRPGEVPWHAAMAATYSHATAPLRRLADRYVVLAALAVANGDAVPAEVDAAFSRLPEVMSTADANGNQLDRRVVDLVEAVVLHGREGEAFAALVTDVDDRGARIQLRDLAVVARVDATGVDPGQELRVRLVDASPSARAVRFERVA
ncbi:MAG: RNB domain-containing ribonuclease [Acidimicrobiales bacterium]|nr:RNB domain-containing ribonuclease [Acidimicrobiales bacterium]MCB9396100.1 RNB domain-containing ribonuclease [Acidimicrobiaceae bacterium]